MKKETKMQPEFAKNLLYDISMQCPICLSEKTSYKYTSCNKHGRHIINPDETFIVYECNNCTGIFLGNIQINSHYYKKYYEIGYYSGGGDQDRGLISTILNILGKISLSKKRKLILKHVTNTKKKLRILDIGCGQGTFLNFLDTKIFEKYGVEINQDGIDLSRRKGLTIYTKELKQLEFNNKKFDVITLWHVLEHLDYPIGAFKKINSILETDGIVILATPNTKSLGFRLGKKNWFHLDSPRHLILFNNMSLQFLCKKTDFEVIDSQHERIDYPLDLLWSVQYSWWRFLIWSFYPFVKLFDQETLTLVLKKKKKQYNKSITPQK